VTGEKQEHLEQYDDKLVEETLYWEGPTDHFAESRLVNASNLGDEIHLFYRERHHSPFRYEGKFKLVDCHLYKDKPSRFVFRRSM
jgi:putative restriction endonuclease